jgi:hypothetical protein
VVGLPVCEVIEHLIKEGIIRMQADPTQDRENYRSPS